MVNPGNLGSSNNRLELDEINRHRVDVESSLRSYFRPENVEGNARFVGYSATDIQSELELLVAENDRNAIFNLVASMEAKFRVDYLQRCAKKKKDPLSRRFFEVYKDKQRHVSLEEDIFEAWKQEASATAHLISALKGVFKYRHWLAHGRYWTVNYQRYEYDDVFALVQRIEAELVFEQ